MKNPSFLQSLGIDYYSTVNSGIGGKIRQTLNDFIVEEISLDQNISYCFKENKKIKLNEPARFLRCSLEKYGIDTLIAIKILADSLKISMRDVQFAGMKDRSAVTSQFIGIERMDLNKIKNKNIKNIVLRNFHHSNSILNIGDLLGNHFVITIRDVSRKNTDIKKNINDIITEIIENKGIINYFGVQRFGEIRPISHLVGKAILKKNYEEAVKIYLTKIFSNESPESQKARAELEENWDYRTVVNKFPSYLLYERLMIKSLIKYPNDYKKAFGVLPSRLQSMLFYAYQSYIFNKILSRRKEQDIAFNNLRINDFVLILDDKGLPTHAGILASEKNYSHLKHLIEKNKAAISAPLVGSETIIRDKVLDQILKEENVNTKDFQSRDYSFRQEGGFRPILFSPINFKIKKIKPDELNPNKNKVILAFSLKRGSYASVLLEEIIKNKKLEG